MLIALAIDVMANEQSAGSGKSVFHGPGSVDPAAVLTVVIWSLESFFEYL